VDTKGMAMVNPKLIFPHIEIIQSFPGRKYELLVEARPLKETKSVHRLENGSFKLHQQKNVAADVKFYCKRTGTSIIDVRQ